MHGVIASANFQGGGGVQIKNANEGRKALANY